MFAHIQDLQAQGKHHCAKLSPRNCQSDCQVGKIVLILVKPLQLWLHQHFSFPNTPFFSPLQVFIWPICWDKQPQFVLKVVLRGTPGSFFLFLLMFLLLVLSPVANYAYFSQSGKLVTKMFQKIQQLIDDKDALVFVLIDEVKWSVFISFWFASVSFTFL